MVKILLVLALPEEGNIQAPFPIVYTGCGKINATMKLMEAIHLHQPKWVINYGSAGGITLPKGSLVSVTHFFQHDMNAQILGFKPYQTPFDDAPIMIEVPNKFENTLGPGKKIGSGDHFVSQGEDFPFDLVDMEAFALAKVCSTLHVPFSCIKYISDGANNQGHEDWKNNVGSGWQQFLDLCNVLEQDIHDC
jgi:adenosylhomocysteine nucleosidase